MPAQGTIVARVYTSNARIPLRGATVAFFRTEPDGAQTLLGARMTNYDGLTDPLSVPTPSLDSASIAAAGQTPYARLTVEADIPGYDRVLVRGAQVFTGIQTLQELALIPTAALPTRYDRTDVFDIPPQTL